MNSKEKAKELVARYMILFSNQEQYLEEAKQCAIIAVDEIVNSVVVTNLSVAENQFIYWEQVKQEINNI
jgi:hypothetical protein